MKKSLLKLFVPVLLVLISQLAKAQFTIDGNFSEWTSEPVTFTNVEYMPIGNGSGWQTIEFVKTHVTNTHVYFYIEGNSDFTFANSDPISIFFNTDKNATTGFNHGGGGYAANSVGAEVAFWGSIASPGVQEFTAGGGWGDFHGDAPWTGYFAFSAITDLGGNKNGFEFSVDRALFGTPQDYITFVFSADQNFLNFKSLPAGYRGQSAIQVNTPTVLPVSLVSFNGTEKNYGVELNWTTATEKNNSHFELYKSADGVSFEKFATVAGNGNSNSTKYYHYTDRSPYAGTNYYQLKQVDYNGNTTEFKPITVQTKLKDTQFEVYANAGNIQVKIYAAQSGTAKFQLTNVYGKRLVNQSVNLTQGSQTLNFPLANVQQQVYIALLNIGQTRLTKKIVIR